MTKRDEVWNLLISNESKWLTRADIEQVGGAEAMRRLRELKTAALGSGYSFEQRQTIGNLLEYRLVKIMPKFKRHDIWACAKCGAERLVADLQPSTDGRDRYRLGPCAVCHNNHAIFRKEAQ